MGTLDPPWPVTTHRWTRDVDPGHLARARACSQALGTRMATHLVLEVVAYADDEAEALGRRGSVTVTMSSTQVTVTDDGRGTDTRVDGHGRAIRKPVMATEDVRFFDAESPPRLPDGLPRRGMSTVAAVCPFLAHENHRQEGSWRQDYRYGIPVDELQESRPSQQTGTTVRFRLPSGSTTEPERLGSLLRELGHVDVAVN